MTANVALTDTFDQWRVKTNEFLVGTQSDGMNNIVKVIDTTNSTSNSTGSIITAGGIGITKSVVIGENLNVHGNIHANGAISADGSLTLGDADTDSVDFNADIASHIIPNANLTYNIGNTTMYWANTWSGHLTTEQKTDSGKPAITVSALDLDQIAVDINAGQTTANVVDIVAANTTTGTGLYMSMASLTTGPALYIDSDSDSTGIRSIASIIQNHASAVNATGLTVQADAGRGLFINTTLAAGGYSLEIDATQAATNTAKIASAATTGTILDIQAESLTEGRAINIYDDSLTIGSALYIDSDSSSTGIRNIASIIQNHASAVNATTLYVQNDSTGMGVDIRGGIGTGAAGAGKLRLSTAETTVVDGDVLGMVQFMAPLEAGGTDAVLVAACIQAEADDTFAADNNATELVFKTAASEAATEKIRITSDGKLGINTATPAYLLDVQGTVGITGVTTHLGNLIVGADGAGTHDVIFYGQTASSNMTWDASGDDLIINDARLLVDQDDNEVAVKIDSESTSADKYALEITGKYGIYVNQDHNGGFAAKFYRDLAEAGANPLVSMLDENTSTTETTFYLRQDGTGDLVNFYDGGTERFTILDGGNVGINQSAPASALHVTGTVQVGVDNTGHDVKFFGATAGKSFLWDESADELVVTGRISHKKGSAYHSSLTSVLALGY